MNRPAWCLAALAAALAAPSARSDDAPPPEVEILQKTGDCADALVATVKPGEPTELAFTGFTAVADKAKPRSRKDCNVRLRVDVPAGFQVDVGVPELKGLADVGANGTGNVSVRWYQSGVPGDEWFKGLEPGTPAAAFDETPGNWQGRRYGCGESPELNVLVDLTARLRSSAAETESSTVGLAAVGIPVLTYHRCVVAAPSAPVSKEESP